MSFGRLPRLKAALAACVLGLSFPSLSFGLETESRTWSGTLLRHRDSDAVGVYFTRHNSQTPAIAAAHALAAKRPAVIIYPRRSRMLSPERIGQMARSFPFIRWLPSEDINVVTSENVAQIKALNLGKRFNIFIPEISLDNAYGSPLSGGMDQLLRMADEVHVYEEGIYTYSAFVEKIEKWWTSQVDRRAASEAARGGYLRFKGGGADRFSLALPSLFSLSEYRFYASRLDLLPPSPTKPFLLFDPSAVWKMLSEGERRALCALFDFDPEPLLAKLKLTSRPKLLLLGSILNSPYDPNAAALHAWIDFFKAGGAGDFEIYFKPHPRDRVLREYVKSSAAGSINVIDSNVPFELFTFAGAVFDRYAVASLSSTLLLIPPEKLLHCYRIGEYGQAERAAAALVPREKFLTYDQLLGRRPAGASKRKI